MSPVITLSIAVTALRRNAMRTALTALGMIIGVGAVIVMVAIGHGAQSSIEDRIRSAGTNLFFAWAGVLERGGPHYYRIQAPTFLIEYDNTQNNANHIHSVWRDFEGDFGGDLLKQHYQSASSDKAHGHTHN